MVSVYNMHDHILPSSTTSYCDILVDHSKEAKGKFRSAGAGLIRFKNSEHAQVAITTMGDTELDGRKIFILEDREGREIKGKSAEMKGWGGYDK